MVHDRGAVMEDGSVHFTYTRHSGGGEMAHQVKVFVAKLDYRPKCDPGLTRGEERNNTRRFP